MAGMSVSKGGKKPAAKKVESDSDSEEEVVAPTITQEKQA
jgi:hypothetical protein